MLLMFNDIGRDRLRQHRLGLLELLLLPWVQHVFFLTLLDVDLVLFS